MYITKEYLENRKKEYQKKLNHKNYSVNNGLKEAINDYNYLVEKSHDPTYKQKGITPIIYIYNRKVIAYLLCLNSIGKYPIHFKFIWEDININDKIFVNHPVKELVSCTDIDYIECRFDKEKGKVIFCNF